VSGKLIFAAATVIVSLALTFAPVFAQDTVRPGAADRVGDSRTVATATDDDNGPDFGWLGLLGLVGLAGLIRRDHNDHRHGDRNVTR
jgi:MYXO-CTERM domain-containing protein